MIVELCWWDAWTWERTRLGFLRRVQRCHTETIYCGF